MTEGISASAVAIIVLMLILVEMFARSVWLISWKYAVACVVVLSVLFAVLIIAHHEKMNGIFMWSVAYFWLLYVIYYKYIMRDIYLKLINPSPLIEKSGKEKLPVAWLFIYMWHALFFIIVAYIFLITAFPGIGEM